jgi:hypothetical protein
MKKETTPAPRGDIFKFVMPHEASLDAKILNIYWYKKELDEFLPQIATYATPQEIAGITVSQLAIIEKQLVSILHELSKLDNMK